MTEWLDTLLIGTGTKGSQDRLSMKNNSFPRVSLVEYIHLHIHLHIRIRIHIRIRTRIRPVHLLRVWISEGLTQADS